MFNLGQRWKNSSIKDEAPQSVSFIRKGKTGELRTRCMRKEEERP